LAEELIAFLLEPANFQEYLLRCVVGWVPMLEDAWTDAYLNSPRIAPIKEYLAIGAEAQKQGVVGTGYFGPSAKASVLVATDIEKQIGDRLVTLDQSPEEVLKWAVAELEAAM
jgi:ABC-type glycerol-3-phosphate transport system substrate-binding protein